MEHQSEILPLLPNFASEQNNVPQNQTSYEGNIPEQIIADDFFNSLIATNPEPVSAEVTNQEVNDRNEVEESEQSSVQQEEQQPSAEEAKVQDSEGGQETSQDGLAKQKRNRTNYSPQQVDVLEMTYVQHNRYPTPEVRELVARTLQLKDSQVRIWFQNRRAKDKRRSAAMIVPSAPAIQNINNKPDFIQNNLMTNNMFSHQVPVSVNMQMMPQLPKSEPTSIHGNWRAIDFMLPTFESQKALKDASTCSSSSAKVSQHNMSGFVPIAPAANLDAPPNVNLFNFEWNKSQNQMPPAQNINQGFTANNNGYPMKQELEKQQSYQFTNSMAHHQFWPNSFMPPELMTFSPPFFAPNHHQPQFDFTMSPSSLPQKFPANGPNNHNGPQPFHPNTIYTPVTVSGHPMLSSGGYHHQAMAHKMMGPVVNNQLTNHSAMTSSSVESPVSREYVANTPVISVATVQDETFQTMSPFNDYVQSPHN